MLGAFSDALPASLSGASTLLWLLLFAAAARWPREFRAARARFCARAAATPKRTALAGGHVVIQSRH